MNIQPPSFSSSNSTRTMLALSSRIVPIHGDDSNDRDDDRIAIGPVPVEIPSAVGRIPQPPSLEQQQQQQKQRCCNRPRCHQEGNLKRKTLSTTTPVSASTKQHLPSSLRIKIPTAQQMFHSADADGVNMVRWDHDRDRDTTPWSSSQTSAVEMPIEEQTSRRSSQTLGAVAVAGPSSPSISVQISRDELHRRRRLEEEELVRHQEAEYRDYVFYSRVLSGVQRSCHNSLIYNQGQRRSNGTEHFEENRRCLQHIISTRHDDDHHRRRHDRTMHPSQGNQHGDASESQSETNSDSSMLWMPQSRHYEDHEPPRDDHDSGDDVDEGGYVDDGSEGEGEEDDCIFEMEL